MKMSRLKAVLGFVLLAFVCGCAHLVQATDETFEEEFFYQGDGYSYRLTENGKEVFAVQLEDGNYEEILVGATYNTEPMFWKQGASSQGVSYYTASKSNDVWTLQVYYDMTGDAQAYNQYVFYDNHVQVLSYLKDADTGGVLDLQFRVQPEKLEHRTVTQWVYPSNGDFPYKEVKSTAKIFEFSSGAKMYCFVGGQFGTKKTLFESLGEDISFSLDDNKKEVEIAFDLVFVNSETKDDDAFALFAGQNSPFSVKLSAEMGAESNATLFYTNQIELKLDIVNLTKTPMALNVEYHVYDYYGNEVLGNILNDKLAGREGKEISISKMVEKQGIYFVDYTVSNDEDSYREFYSFALLGDPVNEANRQQFLGVSGVRFGEFEPNDDTVWILEALGASNARVCLSLPDYTAEKSLMTNYLSKLNQSGIDVDGQFLLLSNWSRPSEKNIQQYVAELRESLDAFAPYLSSLQLGNEYNLLNQKKKVSTQMQKYVEDYWNEGYEIVKNQYGLPISAAGVGLSHVDWMEEMVNAGVYDEIDILATHAYGYPHSPDLTDRKDIEFSIESSLNRTADFLEGKEDKIWYLDEVGYPTTANESKGFFSGADLRTQADYLMRSVVLALNYGVDVVEIYNLYDQVNLVKGLDAENQEYNFGLFYYADYYGRIMPKPSAIAFAQLTRLMGEVSDCEEIDMGVKEIRAFKVTLAKSDESIIVAWSTFYHLPNDKLNIEARKPNLPWNNQWENAVQAQFYIEGTDVQVYDMMGNLIEDAQVGQNMVEVELNGSPLFIKYAQN